jgi:Tol biopolymer transport system component
MSRNVRRLSWLGSKGELISEVGESDAFGFPRISPDGARVVSVSDPTPSGNGGAVWITDVATGRPMRFTFEPGAYRWAIWSSSGQQIFVSHQPAGSPWIDVFAHPVTGATGDPPFLSGDRMHRAVQDVSPDGKYLLYAEFPSEASANLMLWSLTDQKKLRYSSGRTMDHARISPDGKWVAYEGTTNGPSRVYIESFPVPGTKYEISAPGAGQPNWSASGSELFLVAEGKLTAAAIATTGQTLQIGDTRVLFSLPVDGIYDVARKTGRFLVTAPVKRPEPATIILNWRAPAGK